MCPPRPISIVVSGLLTALVITAASCSDVAPAKAPDQESAKSAEKAAAQETAQAPAKPTVPVVPATLAEAEAALDLETFPLPEGANSPGFRRMADFNYTVDKPAKEILDFNAQELTKRGWKEVAGSRREGQFSGADFTHGDFHLNLSVMKTSPKDPVMVKFSRYGNVSLTALPTPEGVKQVYAFPQSVMYTTDAPVKETAELCRELMLKAGWTPYGSAGDTAYYRQNAVLVYVNVMSAPGQGGKTAIMLTSTLLSLELPAFPAAIDFRYNDSTSEVSFDTDSSPTEVASFYRKAFGDDGWKATTEEPVVIDKKLLTIFRKPGQEMITITTTEFEGRTRVRIDHQTAVEVAEEELRSREGVANRATYQKGEKPEVAVATPKDLEVQQEKPYALRMRVKRGTAFAVGNAIVEALIAGGWSGDPFGKVPVFGTCSLKKGEKQVWVMATESPKSDPWVAVVGVGVTLKPMNR
ncbi:hypothetical protein [uncultured Gimesia sp.]|uniref:hypothetical protein n=1 Tax=uncultured Gimesia sp. TaxID=1678688 RepID=UPI0026227319|nr:hypothetical protein [uncultured Gimesia sp.]